MNACRVFLFLPFVRNTYPRSEKEVSNLTSVNLRPNESQDQLMRRFRKKVAKSGILSTVRRKRWFISKSELRRIQKKKSIRRIRRRQSERE
jgi:small subunit ribosomal protein S21